MVIVKSEFKDIPFDTVLRRIAKNKIVIEKLKELVKKQKSFEEESMLYKYRGRDKEKIWACMAFFYRNLWNPLFREFVYTDTDDNWENYHIQLEYKGKFSEVEIVYGIGAFCIIGPKTAISKKSKILDLEYIVANKDGTITYVK